MVTDAEIEIYMVMDEEREGTNRNIRPPDDELSFLAHEEWIEAEMIDTQVHPTLTRNTFPIAARIVYGYK